MPSPGTGQQAYAFRPTDLYKDNTHVADGFASAAPVLMTYLPLLALLALNAATVWALRRHGLSNARQGVQASLASAAEESRRRREKQMTRTILAATAFYLLFSLPYAVHNLFHNAKVGYNKVSQWHFL